MAAGQLDLSLDQGATFSTSATFKDSNGVGIDQTGCTFTGQIRSSYESSTVLATFVITLANQITDPGKILIAISAANTALIPVDPPEADCSCGKPRKDTTYQYDIERTNVDLTKDRVLQGLVFVNPEVTR